VALKKVHLSRLSPVKWPVGGRYPRQPQYLSTPIPQAMGDNYETDVQAVDPRGMPLWSNLYRIGSAGALSRVGTFGPAAFGDGEPGLLGRMAPLTPVILALAAGAGIVWLIGR